MQFARRRTFGGLTAIAMIGSLLAPSTFAQAEKRVLLDAVSFDTATSMLTINADILDADGEPMKKIEPGDLEILASGQKLNLVDVQIETADAAKEPVAICILLNASNNYQLQAGEEISVYSTEKEGAVRLIKMLSGNDKVAVLQYHNSNASEPISTWSSNFTSAQTAVENAKGPSADDEGNATIQGAAKAERSLKPQAMTAIDKALAYMADNADKLSQTRRKFLIVMSDGKDRETDVAKIEKQRKSIIERYSDQSIRVLVIGFAPDDKKYLTLLQSTANDTNGVYKSVKELVQIAGAWDSVGSRIKKQFIIRGKLAELPSHGETIKGNKEFLKYNIVLKAKLKDGATEEGVVNDVRIPAPALPWDKWLKWAMWAIGGLLGLGLVIGIIVFVARRKGDAPAAAAESGPAKPEGPHRGRLACIAGPCAGQEFYLYDDVTTLGRIKGNTIVLPDASVSSRHAALKIDQMRYEIADLNSQNKVLVNGQQVHKVFLKDGDRVKLGDSELQFWLK
ncbi:MAG: FHA domain-containing protein [Deltaproteobacteria bacterium]|nr:FHA domain-containing protein [Deltaproteobacteria bacterium]